MARDLQNNQDGIQTMGLPQLGTNGMYFSKTQNNNSPIVNKVTELEVQNQQSNSPKDEHSGIIGQDNNKMQVVVSGSPIPITAAGFPHNHHKILKFSRETNYESDFSINDTETAFPQQPSSGETMDYKYKKSPIMGRQQLILQPQISHHPLLQASTSGPLLFAPVITDQQQVIQQKNRGFDYNQNSQQTLVNSARQQRAVHVPQNQVRSGISRNSLLPSSSEMLTNAGNEAIYGSTMEPHILDQLLTQGAPPQVQFQDQARSGNAPSSKPGSSTNSHRNPQKKSKIEENKRHQMQRSGRGTTETGTIGQPLMQLQSNNDIIRRQVAPQQQQLKQVESGPLLPLQPKTSSSRPEETPIFEQNHFQKSILNAKNGSPKEGSPKSETNKANQPQRRKSESPSTFPVAHVPPVPRFSLVSNLKSLPTNSQHQTVADNESISNQAVPNSEMMRISPEKDTGDLFMLIHAHRQLIKDAPQAMKPTFKKKRNDMVLRQLKFVHESSLAEERRQRNAENDTIREIFNNDRVNNLGIGQSGLLRIIPAVKVLEKNQNQQKEKATASFIENIAQSTLVKQRRLKRLQLRRNNSFPGLKTRDKVQGLSLQQHECQLPNQICKSYQRLNNLKKAQIIDITGNGINDAANTITRRRNSYDHNDELGRRDIAITSRFLVTMSDLYPVRTTEQFRHLALDESFKINNLGNDYNFITIKDGDSILINAPMLPLGAGTNGMGGFLAVPTQQIQNLSMDQHSAVNRLDEQGLLGPAAISNSLKSSVEEIEDFDDNTKRNIARIRVESKLSNNNINMAKIAQMKQGMRLSNLARTETLKMQMLGPGFQRRQTIAASKKAPNRQLSQTNFTLGEIGGYAPASPGGIQMKMNPRASIAPPSPGQGILQSQSEYLDPPIEIKHIIDHDTIEEIEKELVNQAKRDYYASQNDSMLNRSRQGLSPNNLDRSQNESVLGLKSHLSKKILITTEEERQLLRAGLYDTKVLKFQRFFLVPRENVFMTLADIAIQKIQLSPLPMQSKAAGLSRALDYTSSNKLSTHKKIGKSGSQVIGALTDMAVSELLVTERRVLFLLVKQTYDVLKDPQIFNSEIVTVDIERVKKNLIVFQVSAPMIIKLRGIKPDSYELEADGITTSTVIMDFLRERYLSDFLKYSRHLTLGARPTSRYYNTHQAKDLAMLSTTGGFSREHKALPKWKIQNNYELLHFQVAQLRKAYSYWLHRVSMNEDIRRTLFQAKSDLLLMNVRTSINPNLSSAALVEATIDKICHLCCKPEDLYKLNYVFNKSQAAHAGQNNGGASSSALRLRAGGSTLDRSHNDSFYQSSKSSQGQGLDDTLAEYDEISDNINAIYLHNHPLFITYNQDLEKREISIDSFIPSRFRLSTLFGYKSKMVNEGLYEVFEPIADARYILCIAFKRAFMMKREERLNMLAAKKAQLKEQIEQTQRAGTPMLLPQITISSQSK